MKKALYAAILAFIFPCLGINNFYTKNTTRGVLDCVLSVLLCWTGIVPLIIAIINIVRGCNYLWCDSDEAFNLLYVK